MARKPIVFPYEPKIFPSKSEALEYLSQKIQSEGSYEDGEEIRLRYYDAKDGTVNSFNVIVNMSGETAYLSSDYNKTDTMRVIESDEEPEDKNALWVTEEDETESSSNADEIKALKSQLKYLTEIVHSHEHALTNVLEGGYFATNSVKCRMENEDDQEQPEDSEDTTVYASGDTAVSYYELYIGKVALKDFSSIIPDDSDDTDSDDEEEDDNYYLYKETKYYLSVKFYNAENEQIDMSGVSYEVSLWDDNDYIATQRNAIVSLESGTTILHTTVKIDSGDTGEISLSKQYAVAFLANEEPNYEYYVEPNSPHITLKWADTFANLKANADYLCIREFVWCKEDSGLYLKAETPNGNIALYKINGGSSVIVDTGGTEDDEDEDENTTTYEVTDSDNILQVISTDGSASVDENGYLTLIGTVDENGYLILTNE